MSRIEPDSPHPVREPVVTYSHRSGSSTAALASPPKPAPVPSPPKPAARPALPEPEASPWPTILRRSAFAIVFLGSSTALDQTPPPPASHGPAATPAFALKVAERSGRHDGMPDSAKREVR